MFVFELPLAEKALANTKGLNAIAFNMADKFPLIAEGKPFTIVYTIEENKHHAAGYPIQLLVKEIIF